MRCPKCGYISFDQVEACGKCGKNISGAAEKLSGMVLAVESPIFLKFAGGNDGDDDISDKTITLGEETKIPGGGPHFAKEEGDLEFTLTDGDNFTQDSEMAMDLEGFELESEEEMSLEDSLADAQRSEILGDDTEFAGVDLAEDLDEALDLGEAEDLDEALDLGEAEDLEPAAADFLDLDEDIAETVVQQTDDKGPELDFGDLDLSDLAPPVADGEEVGELDVQESPAAEIGENDFELDFGLTNEESVEFSPVESPVAELDSDFLVDDEVELVAEDSPAAELDLVDDDIVEEVSGVVSPAPAGSGLEDLQVEAVEMVSSPLAAPDKIADKAGAGALKTGTALDSFDLDLGELFSDKKD